MTRMKFLLPLICGLLLLTGCGTGSQTGPNPPATPGTVPEPTPPSDSGFTVSLSAERLEGTAPMEVALNATASEPAIFSWYIDSSQLDLTGNAFSYTFDKPGNYLITVSAENGSGEVANDTLTAVITGQTTVPTPGDLILSGTIESDGEVAPGMIYARTLLSDNRSLSESFSRAPVDASGAFRLEVGTPQRFAPFAPGFDCSDQQSIVTEPSTLETAYLMLNLGEDTFANYVYLSFSSGGYGDTLALYLYASGSGTIQGTESCDPYPDENDYRYTYTFDLTLQPGWNLVRFSEQLGNTNQGEGVRYSFESVPPSYDLSEYKWVEYPFVQP